MFKYHVIPLELTAKENANTALIAAKVESLLNYHASQGWEFMHLESIPVTIQLGCLAIFSGGKPQTLLLPQLVFRAKA